MLLSKNNKNILLFNNHNDILIVQYFTRRCLFMKKHLAISISKVFFNIVLFLFGCFLIAFILGMLMGELTLNLFSFFIVSLIYFLIIYDLRKIVYSTNLTPFCTDNVKRFKRIGYSMFLMALIDGVSNFHVKSNFELFATSYGSLKGSFLMYFILACIALVLSEIFEKAVEIKNENDLTV